MSALLLAGALSVCWWIFQDWSSSLERAGDRAQAAAAVVATNTRWISELSHQALSRVESLVGQGLATDGDAFQAAVSRIFERLPGDARAHIVDAQGRVIFTTDPAFQDMDVTDREYFTTLRDGSDNYVSSLIVSRLTGQQVFGYSHRLEREGRFFGAAIVSFDAELLRDIWATVSLGSGSTVSIVRSDGELTARYPQATDALDLADHVLFTQHLPRSDQGWYQAISPADGVERLVGYYKVPDAPLIAIAAFPRNKVLGSSWWSVTISLVLTFPALIAFFLAIVFISRLLAKDLRSQEEIAATVAMNTMLVRDTHHRVKNNLQSIAALIRMHPLPAALKQGLQNRIHAMAEVHEHLYRRDSFSEVRAPSLVQSIVAPLVKTYGDIATVQYDVEEVAIAHEQATPFSLLLNELVTNALKYAARPQKILTLKISLAMRNGNLELTVADNGIGYDLAATQAGLGSQLIAAMTLQLGATKTLRSNCEGTVFCAQWPAA